MMRLVLEIAFPRCGVSSASPENHKCVCEDCAKLMKFHS